MGRVHFDIYRANSRSRVTAIADTDSEKLTVDRGAMIAYSKDRPPEIMTGREALSSLALCLREVESVKAGGRWLDFHAAK